MMMQRDDSTIEMTWKVEVGEPGVDDDPLNPLWRASEHLLSQGAPQERLVMAFVTDQGSKTTLRWLGVFAQTTGDRIVFFHGLNFAPEWVNINRGSGGTEKKYIDIDHISLERDWSRWHFTSRGSEIHVGSATTRDLGKGWCFWFGLSIPSLESLRVVKKHTKVVGTSPGSDAKRRIDSFIDSRTGAQFPVISMPTPVPESESFPYFEIVVGSTGSETYKGPYVGPVADKVKETEIPVMIHPFSIGSYAEAEVVAMWGEGRHPGEAGFVAGKGM